MSVTAPTGSAASSFALPSSDRLAAYGTAVSRIALGLLFLAHAGIKIFVFTPAGTAAYFASLGLPAGLAWLTIAVETIGGAALVLGFHSRVAALCLVPFMLGTIVAVHGANGFLFASPGGGWEYPAFWTISLIAQSLLGDGALSVRRR